MIRLSQFFHIAMSASALAWAFYAEDETRFVQIILASAFFWIVGVFNRWKRISLLGALLFALISVIGLYIELPFGWMLSGALFSYIAYDLSKFSLRLHFAKLGREENIALITRVHLSRIALMTLLGLFLSTIVFIWQNQLDLYWGIFVGIIFLWWMGIVMMREK